MGEFTFKILAKDLGKMERKMLKEHPVEVQRALKAGGTAVVRMLKAKTLALSVWDRGKIYRGWRSKALPKKLTVFNTEEHLLYVEGGRRAGARMPPITPIMHWVFRHLGVDNVKEAKSIAFAIAKSIAKKGIQARPILSAEGTTEQATELVMAEVAKAMTRLLRKASR